MKKNRIFASAVAVSLAAILACGTLAYFTAEKSTTNTFMTYDTENPKPEDIFSIAINEESEDAATTEDGKTYTEKDGDGYIYKQLQPGDVRSKKLSVENTGEYEAYVRVHVTFTKATEWKAILKKDEALTSMLDLNTDLLTVIDVTEDEDADTITYNYYLADPLAADEPENSVALFSTVTIPASITAEQFVSISKFEVTISAEAIQTANTGDTPAEAFKFYDQKQENTDSADDENQ